MVALLGMLAAGGAMGARDASNASVRAQNELEIGTSREMMREEFLNRRFDRELDAARESSKARAQQDDIKYQRMMEDKAAQREHEMKKTGLLNQGRITAASIREGGANARHKERMDLEKNKKNDPKSENEDLYVTLKNGRKYLPQTTMEKEARGLFIGGMAPSYEDALRGLQTGKFLSPALSVPGTFTSSKAVDTAGNISNQLYGNKPSASEASLIIDPKTKKIMPVVK